MKTSLRKTNIVGTIGPASEGEEVFTELVKTGLNVARINFSHGGYEENVTTTSCFIIRYKRTRN